MVEDRGLGGKIKCDSSGTSGWHAGEPPDARMMEVAESHGIQLEHLSRKFISADFEKFDYIIAMDHDNYEDIISSRLADKDQGPEILLMRDFDDYGKGQKVPDPYYGGVDGFENVYQILNRSCANLLDHIVQAHNL